MKDLLIIFAASTICFLTFSGLTLMAQTSASAALASGWYHTFQKAPGASNTGYTEPEFEKKYNLNELRPFGLELLFHHVISDESDATRIGFRFIALSVRKQPKKGAQLNNSAQQQSRLYRNIFLSGVLQRKVYDVDRLQILLDLTMGLAILYDKGESFYESNREFNYPKIAPAIQLGFAYLFLLFENDKTLNYIRVSPRYHYQTRRSFPFTSGFLLDIGIVIQLAD